LREWDFGKCVAQSPAEARRSSGKPLKHPVVSVLHQNAHDTGEWAMPRCTNNSLNELPVKGLESL